MPKRSPTREQILAFIRDFRREKGYAPTVREIARRCNVRSTSVVQYHLDRLEADGLIARERQKFRSLSIPAVSEGMVEIPVLGAIAAGHPIWVPSTDKWSVLAERTIALPPEIARGKGNLYALTVRGNSMVDAMIADGDLVVMEQPSEVKNGDVAACWLRNEQEVTLKAVYFEEGRIRLQPCNPFMMPIYHDAGNVEIQGRVIAVIRVANPKSQ